MSTLQASITDCVQTTLRITALRGIVLSLQQNFVWSRSKYHTGWHRPALPLRCFSEALLIQVVINVETACITEPSSMVLLLRTFWLSNAGTGGFWGTQKQCLRCWHTTYTYPTDWTEAPEAAVMVWSSLWGNGQQKCEERCPHHSMYTTFITEQLSEFLELIGQYRPKRQLPSAFLASELIAPLCATKWETELVSKISVLQVPPKISVFASPQKKALTVLSTFSWYLDDKFT